MKFSVIHPTARVDLKPANNWLEAFTSCELSCNDPEDVEYILVVHASRRAAFWRQLQKHGANLDCKFGRFILVVNRDRDCLVDQCNAGQLAATGEIIVGNQDDMRFALAWDTVIEKLIPDTARKIAVRAGTDNVRKDLLTLPTIVTRALLDEIGPHSPEYSSMYADDEFTAKVRMLADEVISATHLHFEHLHFTNGRGQMDEVYAMENDPRVYDRGLKTLKRRRGLGFPRVELPGFERRQRPGMLEQLAKAAKTAMQPAAIAPPRRGIMACLPGEDAVRLSTVLNLEGYSLSRGFNFHGFLGYCSGPDIVRMQLTEEALEATAKNPAGFPYAFWMDDDNVVTPAQFGRLLDFLEANPLADLVVGWCWIPHGSGWVTSVARFDGDEMTASWVNMEEMLDEGAQIREIPGMASGFPCVLMRRAVLEHLGPAAFQKIPAPVKYGSLGEDFSFFWRAKQAGIRCYLDPLCKVGHMKLQPQEPDWVIPEGVEVPELVKQLRAGIKGPAIDLSGFTGFSGPAKVHAGELVL